MPLPSNPVRLLSSRWLGWRDKRRLATLLARLGRIDATGFDSRSMSSWIDGLGLAEAGKALVEMLARVATYTADLDQLSADAGVAQITAALGPGVRYLDGGWQRLVEVLTSDAAPGQRAARHPVVGTGRVARFLLGISRRATVTSAEICDLNLGPALVVEADGTRMVMQADQRDGRIVAVRFVLDPAKTTHVEVGLRLC